MSTLIRRGSLGGRIVTRRWRTMIARVRWTRVLEIVWTLGVHVKSPQL